MAIGHDPQDGVVMLRFVPGDADDIGGNDVHEGSS
jgi:hypothetical protein